MIERLFAVILIIFLSPILITISIIIAISSGLPVLFIQDRIGKNSKPFRLLKFRTMLNSYDKDGELLSDRERLTKFGRFLRSSSLDELPELFNVLKSEMSIVGPRPLLPEYLPLYSPKQSRRHEVLPGITGWAQINGRNSITWDEKFSMDVWYVDNHTVLLDLKIILITVLKVFKREGINQDEHTTMPFFIGSKNNNNEN